MALAKPSTLEDYERRSGWNQKPAQQKTWGGYNPNNQFPQTNQLPQNKEYQANDVMGVGNIRTFNSEPATLEDYANRSGWNSNNQNSVEANDAMGVGNIRTATDSASPAPQVADSNYQREISLQDNPVQYWKDNPKETLFGDLDPLDVFGGRAAKNAANLAAGAEQRAIDEQARQFDITQEQYRPYREAGQRGLEKYEGMIGQGYDVTDNLPGAYQSMTNIPEFQFQSGNYGMGQGNVPGGFQFGQNEFDQYKDPGYEFEVEENLKALDRQLASRGKRRSGQRSRSLMEMGQDMASDQFSKARGRALQDYDARVGREAEIYGRGVGDYSRRVGREAELYGRGREGFEDQINREQTLSDRDYMDYTSEVSREENAYQRSLEDYARNYLDPMSRYAQLAGRGQGTTLGLANLRQNYAQNIGNNMSNIGNYQAAGKLGQANAYAKAANMVGSYFNQPRNYYASQQNYNYAPNSAYEDDTNDIGW